MREHHLQSFQIEVWPDLRLEFRFDLYKALTLVDDGEHLQFAHRRILVRRLQHAIGCRKRCGDRKRFRFLTDIDRKAGKEFVVVYERTVLRKHPFVEPKIFGGVFLF